MQDELFEDPPTPPAPAPKSAAPTAGAAPRPRTGKGVQLAPQAQQWTSTAQMLPPLLRMGVSTWSYPGWEGLVWDGVYDASTLSRQGLSAYGQHPLMRTVSVDRTFWRPLTEEQYAKMAAQVPEDFRFLVKCPNVITDAMVRGEDGQGQVLNPVFLSPELALSQFVQPLLTGLQQRAGVLLFQLSPLPWHWLTRLPLLWQQLDQLLGAVRAALGARPGVIVAVEVRDPVLLGPELVQCLRTHGATYCVGLHGKMPPIEAQLPVLRALWPGPLVCRWNLNPIFGPFGYPQAQEKHTPFDALRSPDPHTRAVLARTIAGITGAGQAAFVTVSNDAEGCAPRSIGLLAQSVLQAMGMDIPTDVPMDAPMDTSKDASADAPAPRDQPPSPAAG